MVEPHIVAGRWVQLLGNWDSRALGGCWFMSPKRGEPDADAEVRIALWHSAGFATHAAAVTTHGGSTAVVTHAGVTAPFWRQALGGTRDPIEAAGRINELPLEVIHQPGRMLGYQEPAVNVDSGYPRHDDEFGDVRRAARRTDLGGHRRAVVELARHRQPVAPGARTHERLVPQRLVRAGPAGGAAVRDPQSTAPPHPLHDREGERTAAARHRLLGLGIARSRAPPTRDPQRAGRRDRPELARRSRPIAVRRYAAVAAHAVVRRRRSGEVGRRTVKRR